MSDRIKYKGFDGDPYMKWKGEPAPQEVCAGCLNRLSDGECGELTRIEQCGAIRANKCNRRYILWCTMLQ